MNHPSLEWRQVIGTFRSIIGYFDQNLWTGKNPGSDGDSEAYGIHSRFLTYILEQLPLRLFVGLLKYSKCKDYSSAVYIEMRGICGLLIEPLRTACKYTTYIGPI